MRISFFSTLFISACVLTSCSQQSIYENALISDAKVTETTKAEQILVNLPEASQKAVVAVYDFQDQTGQFKYNDRLTDYSSAVTKGGLAMIVNALLKAGDRGWFKVVERGGLNNLLTERRIVNNMRKEYQAADGASLPELPSLTYAGLLIEGGIISYDSNTLTGGLGANYLGIGGNTEYRSDVVTVYLRAVKVVDGEVLLSVTSSKTVFSTAVNANLVKFVSFDKLLQAETGFSINEPPQFAVRQAIETAVYSLIMEGVMDGLWGFADPISGRSALEAYLERKAEDTELDSEETDDNSHTTEEPASTSEQGYYVPTDASLPPSDTYPPTKQPVRATDTGITDQPAPVRNDLPDVEFVPLTEAESATPSSVRRADSPNSFVRYMNRSRYYERRRYQDYCILYPTRCKDEIPAQ